MYSSTDGFEDNVGLRPTSFQARVELASNPLTFQIPPTSVCRFGACPNFVNLSKVLDKLLGTAIAMAHGLASLTIM